jgi:Abortive infection alpha
MTGTEPIAAHAAIFIGSKTLAETPDTKKVLNELAKTEPAMQEAARLHSERVLVRQSILSTLFAPLRFFARFSTNYFDQDFPHEMAEHLADVPEEDLVSPPPTTAVPTMQGLAYSLDEPTLKEMYLSLLARASDKRSTQRAHPAFADIIWQLQPEEAALLKSIFAVMNISLPMVRLAITTPGQPGDVIVRRHLLDLRDGDTRLPVEDDREAAWVDNWVRLGLVHADYSRLLLGEHLYDWVKERPEYKKLPSDHVVVHNGYIQVTDFGRLFASVVLSKPTSEPPPAE